MMLPKKIERLSRFSEGIGKRIIFIIPYKTIVAQKQVSHQTAQAIAQMSTLRKPYDSLQSSRILTVRECNLVFLRLV